MSSADTRVLIEGALKRFADDVPALGNLNLVMRLELQSRGETPVWRIELPKPVVSRNPAGDARITVSSPRAFFNELAKDGRLEDWVEAYEHGYVKVTGETALVKLLASVIQRQLARSRAS